IEDRCHVGGMTAPLAFLRRGEAIEEIWRGRLRRVDEPQTFAKLRPCKIVPGDSRRAVRFESDVHAKARFTGHFLDDEIPAPIIVRILGMVRAFCFLRGHLETEEANVRFDLRAENWETDFVMHFSFRFNLMD